MVNITIAKDKRDKSEHSISELNKLRIESLSDFDILKANLVCEDCGKPQMIPKLGSQVEHHFATAKKQTHNFGCYYFGTEYAQKEVEHLVENIKNHKPSQEQVLSAFAQIQRYLTLNNSQRGTVIQTPLETGNGCIKNTNFENQHQQESKSKYIPRKKLTKKISIEDVGIYKIYYGQVLLKHLSSNQEYKNFAAYTNIDKEKMSYRISIGISNKVYDYFKEPEKNILEQVQDNKKILDIMVLGKIKQNGNYNNIVIYDTRLLHLSEI